MEGTFEVGLQRCVRLWCAVRGVRDDTFPVRSTLKDSGKGSLPCRQNFPRLTLQTTNHYNHTHCCHPYSDSATTSTIACDSEAGSNVLQCSIGAYCSLRSAPCLTLVVVSAVCTSGALQVRTSAS